MGSEKVKPLITSFTTDGDFLAVLASDGIVKIWNTSDGSLLAEWKDPDGDSAVSYSCMACSYIGKKRRKKGGTLLLALGTYGGDVLAINIFTGERKWISTRCHHGGTTNLSFADKGRTLYTAGTDGNVSELDSETGELRETLTASRKPISSLSLSFDEKILAVASAKVHVFSLEKKTEIQKFHASSDPVQYMSVSDSGKAIVTSLGEKQLQVWDWDQGNGTSTARAVLSMQNSPLLLECKNTYQDEDGLCVLSVSEEGIAYVWDLMTISQDKVLPTAIKVKSLRKETDQRKSSKKSRIPIIAARLHDLQKHGHVSVLIAYGSTSCPRFDHLNVSNPGEEILITAADEGSKTNLETPLENGDLGAKEESISGLHNLDLEITGASGKMKRKKKKRLASDPDLESLENKIDSGELEAPSGIPINDNLNEPTMGEKLASLNLLDDDKARISEKQEPSVETKPPSADSVHILLKQALHADDRALLLDCLYTQDEKVIANSTSLLKPSDVIKLLDSLVSIIHSRGAVLACALPWLRSLLLQHASGIMSQESSLLALNSIYQLIESRVSTFRPALQLSSCLDYLYAGITDEAADEKSTIMPIIYEDNDESDEDAMETDEESNKDETINGFSDFGESDSMSD